MTGALKLKLGIFAGGCQFDGSGRGPPRAGGPWLSATPGGATPGGAAALPGGPEIVSLVAIYDPHTAS
jgi:hypothetical protein